MTCEAVHLSGCQAYFLFAFLSCKNCQRGTNVAHQLRVDELQMSQGSHYNFLQSQSKEWKSPIAHLRLSVSLVCFRSANMVSKRCNMFFLLLPRATSIFAISLIMMLGWSAIDKMRST